MMNFWQSDEGEDMTPQKETPSMEKSQGDSIGTNSHDGA